MEENFRPEASHPPPPSPAAGLGCNRELTLSNLDASSPTAENCKDLLRRSLNVPPDNNTAWTDEKHNSYLHHLEVTFVKQLHQSKPLPTHCSNHDPRHTNMSQNRLTNVTNASDQFKGLRNGCWRKINCVKGSLELWSTVEQGKRAISHELATCSQKYSRREPDHGDLEGSGQNFLDEDNQSTSKWESHANKSKKTFRGSSLQDQVIPRD